MNRPFSEDDNGRRFEYLGNYGVLEFPLTDPGSASPDEGVLWYDEPRHNGWTWEYVKPIDVEPASSPKERRVVRSRIDEHRGRERR